MGNSHNKLERKFSSLPSQSFPSSTQRGSLRKSGSWSRKRAKNEISFVLQQQQQEAQQNGHFGQVTSDLSLVSPLFLPEYPDNIHDSLVDDTNFKVEDVIAKGAFGNVLKVRRLRDNIVYAMKVMKKAKIVIEGAINQCKDEASIVAHVGYHSFIVKPYWFFQNDHSVYIVMEYIPRGELFAAWKHYQSFSEALVKLYIAELALVLDFLHNEGIIYRDLKMENILLDAQGHLQIIDFGLAKWLPKGKRTATVCGTLQYIAPEVLSLKPYGHSVDWWSLGILAYALLVGQYPVKAARNHFEMAQVVTSYVYELPCQYPFSFEVRECIRQLLQKNPKNRVSNLQAIVQLPFFYDLDFEKLISRDISPNKYIECHGSYDYKEPEKEEDSFDQFNRSFASLDILETRQRKSNRHGSNTEYRDSSTSQENSAFAWRESVASLDGMYV